MIPRALRLTAGAAWWLADTLNDVASDLSDLATLVEDLPSMLADVSIDFDGIEDHVRRILSLDDDEPLAA